MEGDHERNAQATSPATTNTTTTGYFVNDTQRNRRAFVPEGIIDDRIAGSVLTVTATECIELAKRVKELDPAYLGSMLRLSTEGLKTSKNPGRLRDLAILQAFCQAQLVLNMAEAVARRGEARLAAKQQEGAACGDSWPAPLL
jgi:hypothetical protein